MSVSEGQVCAHECSAHVGQKRVPGSLELEFTSGFESPDTSVRNRGLRSGPLQQQYKPLATESASRY